MTGKNQHFKKSSKIAIFVIVMLCFLPAAAPFYPAAFAVDETGIVSEGTASEQAPASEENNEGEDGSGADNIDSGTSSPAINAEEPVFPDESEESGTSTAKIPAGTDASSTMIGNVNSSELANMTEGEGDTGENSIASSSGDSLIYTGDAAVSNETVNNVNNNSAAEVCGDECGGNASSSETIAVENKNFASTTNGTELSGNTGKNTIATTSGAAAIFTGNIDIFNAVINFINTNFFGFGREFFLNFFIRLAGVIDLSGYGEAPADEITAAGGASGCEPDCVINIDNASTSTLNNLIDITADTGTNLIASAGGPAIIRTGDINILNDIVNIANLNIAGSDWFFAVVNVFDVLEGDIILPSLDGGINGETDMAAIEGAAKKKARLIVANDNFADAADRIDVTANTGNNVNSGTGTTTIDTGDATIEVKQFNLVNYNFTGNGWRFIRVNLFGAWDGSIEGLPEGYDYIEDESGITIYNNLFWQDLFNDTFAKLAVVNTNYASTTNNVTIDANTGANGILHGEGGGSIVTGDIFIKNILLNFLNSNFIGNDWLFSMINIFGEWQGNLAFGRPKLWIAEAIDAPPVVSRGDHITYTFLFGNSGDSAATDVKITDDFDERYVAVAETAGGDNGGGKISWTIGRLPPGSQGSLSYTVAVKDDIPYGTGEIVNTAVIGGAESDRDPAGNITGGSVPVYGGAAPSGGGDFRAAVSGGPEAGGSGGLPALSIIKTNDAGGAVRPGDRVNYRVIIKNMGGAALEDVLVADIMTDEAGQEEINRDFWDLETLYAGEEVIIDYTVEIRSEIKGGVYVNEAIAEGYDRSRARYISAIASSKIKVENDASGGRTAGPLLEVNLVSRPSVLRPGDTGEQEIIITNNGGDSAEGVTITESLPRGLTFSGDNGNIKKWEIGVIAPGEFKNILIDFEAGEDSAAGIYTAAIVVKAENHGPVVLSRDLKINGARSLPAIDAEKADDGSIYAVAGREDAEESGNDLGAAPLGRLFDLDPGGERGGRDAGADKIPVSAGAAKSGIPVIDFAVDLVIAILLLGIGFYAAAELRKYFVSGPR